MVLKALHEDVKEKYGVVLKTYKELESLEDNGSKETKPLVEFKHSEEAKKVGSILIDLLAASEIIKGSAPVVVQSSTPSTASKTDSSEVKVTKIESLKFAGHPRDFADFSKQFKSIIVPHRSKVEVGWGFT